ncbi:MAG: DUF3866 family protein [Armatimonadota bacterium]
MLNRREVTVQEILTERPGIQELLVDGGRAVNYPALSGPVFPGDRVLVNTTAVDLALGTGGVHFVICNLSRQEEPHPEPGHIMKLRYTPLQTAVLSVEEASPEKLAASLDGFPVVCCELHSQVAPVAAAVKARHANARVAYVMTDGAALPLAFSRLVSELRGAGLIDTTVTCGQAFGGEIEAINLYTGLLAARSVADVAVVAQGPGNAGAGTKYGFSGLQQAEAVNAAGVLGGRAVVALRVSFADPRERHRGISHHSLTALQVALQPAIVALPELSDEKMKMVTQTLDSLPERYEICTADGEPGLAELARRGVKVRTMGRSVDEDREFFLAASAAGALAV